ncbi:MAG: hypothetical protein A2Y40_04690 [Candidatus Margulisbacteria bacterium GWF2_35_9]|nr:MAG: hypothetical protein A2Y40_04690 [Candidatus Margulisbacteria bacterium GWF2_35_9]
MKRKLFGKVSLLLAALLLMFGISFCEDITKAQVLDIVDDAVTLIEQTGDAALSVIGTTNGKFHKGELYVFCYDTDVVITAHPEKPFLVGKSYKGKPDVKGKNFRDEIVQKALDGSGWVTYYYQKPGETGIFLKTAYGRLATKNGKKYIVVSGMYADKQ